MARVSITISAEADSPLDAFDEARRMAAHFGRDVAETPTGPGLARTRPTVIDTTAETVAEVIPLRRAS